MIVYLKTNEEIEGFKRAGKFASDLLAFLLDKVEVGIDTNYLDTLARQKCKELGVNPAFLGYEGYPAAICTSVNNILVHGLPNNIPLQCGDIVGIDVGVEIGGFIGDTADSVCVNGESELINKCREALVVGIAAATPGNYLNDIGKAIEKKSKPFKIPKEYGGHGIDRWKMHAAPFVSNFSDVDGNIKLRPGMILCIEPMIVDGNAKTSVTSDKWSVKVGGPSAHCEHTILITEADPIILTRR